MIVGVVAPIRRGDPPVRPTVEADTGGDETRVSTRRSEDVPPGIFEADDVLANRYQIRRRLGVGGMGEVYEAFDFELQIPVALKTIRPEIAANHEIADRFRREIFLARKIADPHVCRIFDL